MIFVSQDCSVSEIEPQDFERIAEVYNSNANFLQTHLNCEKVTPDWVSLELASMREAGFHSCKIVHRETGEIIGLLDFKIDSETYLSLLMIHKSFANQGFGTRVYHALEAYTKSHGAVSIRLDVVIAQNEKAAEFWVGNGFQKAGDVELSWNGQMLSAVTMKKQIR